MSRNAPVRELVPTSVGDAHRQTTLGVVGGGQLGRMFVQAAQAMGYRTCVLDPDTHSPAGSVADVHLKAHYTDPAALEQMAQWCDAITTEFENVPAQTLQDLARACLVAPSAQAVSVCQERAREKALFVRTGVPCVAYQEMVSEHDLKQADPALFPAVLKTSTLGYDGKGQASVQAWPDLAQAWEQLGRVACVLEQRVALRAEFSVVLARDARSHTVYLPLAQNVHRQGILDQTTVPADDVLAQYGDQARDFAKALADSMDYVGVLCVEFFVTQDGQILANEMAPRPHNSGHFSLDACDISQFELQVRCLAGLPLVTPRLHSASVMINLLGDLWFPGPGGDARTPPWAHVLQLPGVHLHLYGKQQPRVGRKMGHLTVTAATAQEAASLSRTVRDRLGLPPTD